MLNLPDIQTGEDITRKGGWLNALKREVQRLGKIKGDGSNIAVSDDGGGITVRLMQKANISPSESIAYAYAGPFAVTKKDDTTVTLLGNHSDEGRGWTNYVTAGLSAVTVAEQDKGSITSSGYLYLDVSYSSGYSVAVAFGSLPSQSSTHYYHPIAYITCVDSKISSIDQLQYGNVYIAGRVV